MGTYHAHAGMIPAAVWNACNAKKTLYELVILWTKLIGTAVHYSRHLPSWIQNGIDYENVIPLRCAAAISLDPRIEIQIANQRKHLGTSYKGRDKLKKCQLPWVGSDFHFAGTLFSYKTQTASNRKIVFWWVGKTLFWDGWILKFISCSNIFLDGGKIFRALRLSSAHKTCKNNPSAKTGSLVRKSSSKNFSSAEMYLTERVTPDRKATKTKCRSFVTCSNARLNQNEVRVKHVCLI